MLYKFTHKASDDLTDIYLYGFINFGEPQAEHYFTNLEKCFQLLSETPLMCRGRTEFSPLVRIHHHKHHLIIYTIQPEHILIVRILHDTVDIQRHLND